MSSSEIYINLRVLIDIRGAQDFLDKENRKYLSIHKMIFLFKLEILNLVNYKFEQYNILKV